MPVPPNDEWQYYDSYVACDCESDTHNVRFTYSKDDQYGDELWISVHLNQHQSFWKRLWTGIRYIFFGFAKTQYGHYDTFSFKAEDAPKMKQAFEYFILRRKKKLLEGTFYPKQNKRLDEIPLTADDIEIVEEAVPEEISEEPTEKVMKVTGFVKSA